MCDCVFIFRRWCVGSFLGDTVPICRGKVSSVSTKNGDLIYGNCLACSEIFVFTVFPRTRNPRLTKVPRNRRRAVT
jgi:hypothetical protein